jgi:hypothetical protein
VEGTCYYVLKIVFLVRGRIRLMCSLCVYVFAENVSKLFYPTYFKWTVEGIQNNVLHNKVKVRMYISKGSCK